MITNSPYSVLPWERPPLSLLPPDQQIRFQHESRRLHYRLGEVIWNEDNIDEVILVLAGKVRLVDEKGHSILVQAGDWLGGMLDLPSYKARAAVDGVETLIWKRDLWESQKVPAIDHFWDSQSQRYLLKLDEDIQAIEDLPSVAQWRDRGNSVVSLICGCIFLGVMVAQLPGAIVGGVLGAIVGWVITEPKKASQDLR